MFDLQTDFELVWKVARHYTTFTQTFIDFAVLITALFAAVANKPVTRHRLHINHVVMKSS
jgi:hypothetical protein